jgi:Protein of unknown function (DUF4232)
MKSRLALASLAVLAVAGCSSGSSGGGSNTADTPPPVTTTASQSATPSQTPSSSPTATPTPSFSTTIKASHSCATSDLMVTVGQGQGAAGSTVLPLVFTNNGSKPCTMYGYPGVSFLDANENQIGAAAARSGGEEAVVTLAPGAAANAQLQVPDPGNFSPADCNQAKSTFIRVYPPGEKHFIEINEVVPICTTTAGVSSVRPVTPGNGS